MNYYRVSDQPVPTPDVRSSIRGDLYINLMAFESSGANATVKVIVEPLVPWIWFGGLVVVIGAITGLSYGPRGATATATVKHSAPNIGRSGTAPLLVTNPAPGVASADP